MMNKTITEWRRTRTLSLFAAAILSSSECVHAAPQSSDEGLFDPDRVIQVEVMLDPDDWYALRISHRTRDEDPASFATSKYEYFRGDVVIDGEKVQSVGVRKKGFLGSVVSTRPSLKIRFDKFVDDQEFSGLDMMTLNNNNQDPTQAQQILSYGFFNAAGAVSPRCSLAHVTVNGEDLGIYTHLESIRKPFIKSRLGTSKGDLYEGYAGDFREERFSRIVHKWGKDDDLVALKELNDVIHASDPVDLEKLEVLLDLDSFITLWAAEVLIGHWDGYAGNRNNWYAFRSRESGKFTIIPWGADSVFDDPGPFIFWAVPKSVKANGIICQKLWELPEIRKRYRAEMQRLLDDVWDEEAMLTQLQAVQGMSGGLSESRPSGAAAGIGRITQFIQKRRDEVQAELDAPAVDWPQPPNQQIPLPPDEPPVMMTVSGTFTTTMQAEMPLRAAGDSVSLDLDLKVPLDAGETSVRYQVEGESGAPFTRAGVLAFPESPISIRPGYPSIQIRAAGEEGDPTWCVSFILDPIQLKSGGHTLISDMFTVWSVISKGEFGTEDFRGHFFGVTGEFKIDQFSRRPGGIVSGSFELHAPAFEQPE